MRKRRKRYDKEFKRDAVELLLHGGKQHKEVCEDLEISQSTLSGWQENYLQSLEDIEVNGEMKTAKELFAENQAIRKELEYVKRQRDILKKAMSIVAEESKGDIE